MADYYTNRESRADRHGLPSNYIYTAADSKGRRSVMPKPDSPSPAVEFPNEVSLVYNELMTLLLSKHEDYGPSNIANAPGGALNGLRVRMHDKLARINNLVDNNKNPEHESLEDSFKDMANYAIIGLLVLRDKWNK